MMTVQERKAAERLARRRRIQQAAKEVFVERGYGGASIEHIARSAQLSVGAIYLYFRSKEDLYSSLLEEPLTVFDAELTHMRQRVEAAHRFDHAWMSLVSWATRDSEGPRILRLVAQPGVREQLSDDVATAVESGLRSIRAHLAACISDGVNEGMYRAINTAEAAELSWAMLLGILSTRETQVNLLGPDGGATSLADLATRALEMMKASMLPNASTMPVAARTAAGIAST